MSRFFGEGVSPAKLAAGAIIPTIVVAICMMCFPDKGIAEMFAMEKERGYVAPVIEEPVTPSVPAPAPAPVETP